MAFERQIHSADSLVSKIVKGHCDQMGEETEEWYARAQEISNHFWRRSPLTTRRLAYLGCPSQIHPYVS